MRLEEFKMANQDIRMEVKSAGLRFWQIADKLGINGGNFSRKLRHELSDTEKGYIRGIIAELSKEARM